MMGLKDRRKVSKKRGRPASLSRDDLWEMISYLDYCLLVSPDFQRFKDTITAHLEKRTEKWFPFDQIDRKIEKLWNDEGIKTATKGGYESIYHYGSAVLDCVQNDPELKRKIKERTKEIQEDKIADYLRSDGRTRGSLKTEHHIILVHGQDVGGHPRRTPRKVIEKAPTQAHSGIKTDESEQLEEVPASVDGVLNTPTSFHTPTSSLTVSGDERLHSPSPHVESPESEDDMSASSVSVLSIKHESVGPLSSTATHLARSELSTTPASRVEQWTLFDPRAFQESQSQIVELRRENVWHREEVLRLHRVNSDLRIRLTATTVSKIGHDSTQQRLIDYQCEIHRLNSIIRAKEILAKPGRKPLTKEEREEIVHNMEVIEKSIGSVFIFLENMGSCGELDSDDKTGDLSLLWQRALGSSRTAIPPVPFQHVLRSLLSAAICMWVFEADFNDVYLADSHLRNTMLSNLRMHDCEEKARDLDLTSHKDLIASKYFQENRIPLHADDLAGRLSDALGPLLEQRNSLAGSNINVSAKWAKRRGSLKRIFETALRIKVAVLVSPDVFEVVLPAWGATFDPKLMSREHGSAATEPCLVRLAVAPGLRGFEFNRQQVDYNSFRTPVPSVGQEFDMIKQALVVLE